MKLNRFLFIGLWVLQACSTSPSQNTSSTGSESARSLCVSCHQYPEPGLLDKNTWQQFILPRMGYMYGIYPHDSTREDLFEKNPGRTHVERIGIFPSQPTVDQATWEEIYAFYIENAPQTLLLPSIQDSLGTLSSFEVEIPPTRMSPPSTTWIEIAGPGAIYLGDVHTETLYFLDETLTIQRAAKVGHGAMTRWESKEALYIGVMGSFSPTDNPTGYVLELPLQAAQRPRKVISRLQRPVSIAQADLDGDGLLDYVICEYAKWTGRLAWWKQKPDGSFQPKLLRNRPGAIEAFIQDWNQDGKQDIIALFGQGDEGIFLYLNQGNGVFQESPLLRFPPSYGSSSLQLIDWDQDGDSDIVYTAGDNADYLPVLKPYHGIRIFLNTDGTLEEYRFLPMHGAYGTAIRDFDKDGDLDIAAVSFFPDFTYDSTGGFRYFQNQGDDQFKRFSIPEASLGRWIVLDAGDVDGDGDEDIVLGSLAFEVTTPGTFVEDWVGRGIPFLLLKNKLFP
ncbi:MAG: VCBS repeat-containing protein [Bacteroidota bacterium]